MFLKNFWYVAAWAEELTTNPLARRILDQPVVLFRTEGGIAAALDDCCPHRMAELSLGTVEGEHLRCPYHGLLFDAGGRCVEMPGDTEIPSCAHVKAYPVEERDQLIWIWMGDPAAADRETVPAMPWLSSPDWADSHGLITYDCSYVLLCDNLMDLSHTTFVHKRTIGTGDVAKTPVTTAIDGDMVTVERVMHDTEPSIMYRRAGGFTGRVDRWQTMKFTAPCNIVIDAGAVPAGTNDMAQGIDTRVINLITPETPTSTFHFWAFARNFRLDDPEMTDYLGEALTVTFNEDKALIDGQQRNVTARPKQHMFNKSADSGVVGVRRIIRRLLEAEGGSWANFG
jgi:phenylpropionate dioxygenase-like ring-hydroxylating dioxygenase large terminal subunit